jgi:hypothetical protein
MNAKAFKSRLAARVGCDDSHIGAVSCQAKDVEVKGDGRMLSVVANTTDIDLESEVVDPDGAELDYILANRKVFVDHEYTVDRVVGKIRNIRRVVGDNDRTIAWKVDMGTHGALGSEVVEAAQAIGIGASIGFQALEFGPPTKEEIERFAKDGRVPDTVVRRWRWLELSLTHFPCNVSCQSDSTSPVHDLGSRAHEAIDHGILRPDTARKLRVGVTRIRV